MKRTLMISALVACSLQVVAQVPTETEAVRKPSFQTGGNVLIKNGRVLTVTRGVLDGYDILVQNGRIAQVGKNLSAPGVRVIDATGKFVTPGLVDAHSHRGSDATNEGANAITSEVRILDVLNPNQPNLYYALASGMTTSLVLHGSANPIGGQSLVIKHKWMRPANEVVFDGAPKMIKFALGENPKGDPSSDNPRFPATRMGVEAIIRRAFADARDYIDEWDEFNKQRSNRQVAAPPRRDLRLEGLADILRGRTWVQCHSYRQDEMLMMVRLSQELGFKLVMQHALEGYKIAPELAKANVPVSIFGGGFAYKLEVVDSMPMAAAILDKAGVLVSVNTDTGGGIAPITHDAARAMRYGLSADRALRLITINPAKQLGVDHRVGSIEVGKDADIAIWSGHPLSTYTKCTMTLIEGEVFFERKDQFAIDSGSMSPLAVTPNEHNPAAMATLPNAPSYLITGGTVHPVSGPAQPGSNVLIENGRIVAVGPNVRGKAGTVTVQARGMHVFPGFIDAWARPGLDNIGQIPQSLDSRENGDFKPDLRAINSTNPESEHLPKAYTHGVTSIFDTPTGGVISGQAAMIHTFGFTTEDLAVVPLAGLVVNVPAGVEGRMRERMSPEDIARIESGMAQRSKQVSDYFAAANRYLTAKDSGAPIQTDIKLESMRPYLNGSLPVFFVANSTSAIRNAISYAKEFKVKGVLVGGADSWKMTSQLKAANMPVILAAPKAQNPDTDSPQDSLDPYDTPFVTPELLRRAGVKFALMTNGYESVFNLPNQAGRLCAFGLPWEAAIRALTLDAAEIVGVGNQLGSLEKGKIANVIITDGDPLEMTTQVRYTFIKGRPAPMSSKYTDLFEKYMGRVGNL